jgi:mono/diheme cytochrome c family protein
MTGVRAALAAAAAAAVAAAAVAWWLVPLTEPARVREDLPPEFADKRNPLAGADVIAAGAALFQANCASCHGEHADGRGPASRGLTPPPADFRSGSVLGRHTDAYLYYRVSTGKAGTAMPSFHGVLDETERWQVIAYLRSLGPAAGTHP